MDQSTSDKAELTALFREKKKELAQVRSELNNALRKKEDTFREVRSIRDKIKSRSEKIKTLKTERNALTDEVKKLKEEREKLNSAVKEQAVLRKEADQKKQELVGKYDARSDPSKLKARIEQLERKMETEVMPFSKEKELTKELKDLKIQYKKLSELGQVWDEIHKASSDFSKDRRKAQESHESVQEKAHASQEKHEFINSLYEEVKKLREQEKPLSDKFSSEKRIFEEMKVKADELGKQVSELAKQCGEEEDRSFKAKVYEKTEEVRDKIKKGKKLSTEDILAFQALDDRD